MLGATKMASATVTEGPTRGAAWCCLNRRMAICLEGSAYLEVSAYVLGWVGSVGLGWTRGKGDKGRTPHDATGSPGGGGRGGALVGGVKGDELLAHGLVGALAIQACGIGGAE